MRYFAVLDAQGNVVGRIKVSREHTAKMYEKDNIEIDRDQWRQRLEHTHTLDRGHHEKTGQKRLKIKD